MSAHSHSGWITVGALADGFAPDNHVLPACGDLAGLERVHHLHRQPSVQIGRAHV